MLLTGCARTTIGLDNAALVRGNAPAPGSFYNSASVQAELRPNTYFSLFFLGLAAAGAQDQVLGHNDSAAARKAPQLDARRRVEVRDCTLPMEHSEANLSCR